MNPLYQQLMNGAVPSSTAPSFMPIAKMQAIMNAIQNPAAFIKQAFPDIPEDIQNDPSKILGYLQKTRNISNDQIQQLMNQMQTMR